MAILVQKTRRHRRWAGVASFAALLLALWWTEHDSAPPDAVASPEDVSVHEATETSVALNGLGPSFSAEPLAALPD